VRLAIGLQSVGVFPGGIGQGKTKEDVIQNIREAIEGYVLALKEDGLAIPPDNFDAVLAAV
jgi:predicted RNase H-like HicB family nuclease